MLYPMRSSAYAKVILASLAGWVLVLALQATALACGGAYIPGLSNENDTWLLHCPSANFVAELQRIMPLGSDTKLRAVITTRRQSKASLTARAAQADLVAAMEADKTIPAPRRKKIVSQYTATRKAITEYRQAVDDWEICRQRNLYYVNARNEPRPVAPELTMPTGLPREFDMYLSAAAAWHAGRIKEAVGRWEALLELPAAKRKYRSVWAAFMLGRAAMKNRPPEAMRRFAQTRKLAEAGFADSAGLAVASVGWQARLELDRGRFDQAVELYLLQYATGDPSAAASLRICADKLVKTGPIALAAAARSDRLRPIITAHVLAGQSTLWVASQSADANTAGAWLKAVEASAARSVRGADRLAWLAYQSARMDAASRWVSRAPADAPIAQWITAKLLLRAGKLDQAATVLAKVVRAMPPNQPCPTTEDPLSRLPYAPPPSQGEPAGELAALKLARCQYVDALDLLVRHGYEFNAAYVAERILTIKELKAYVDDRAPKNAAGQALRNILARRLTRAGKWKLARPYYPPDMQRELDSYIAAIRAGHDQTRTSAQRAQSHWRAATALVKDGQRLLGYDTGWYGKESDGRFHRWPEFARTSTNAADPSGATAALYTIAPASADERRRVGDNQPQPLGKWHHLYEAADHAWSACELMPDGTDETALRLCRAGRWLMYRDPSAANRFYKALVRRCGQTKLGKQAAELHWLPGLGQFSNE